MAGDKNTVRTIRTFSIASFLNDMGSDMIFPVWPLFLSGVMGANMAMIGFIDGLGEAVVSLSQAASGYFSDRLQKRKPFIWAGYLFASAARLGYALSHTWQQVIPFRILDRSGKIRSAPRDAVVADISTRENRGKHFGWLRTMDNLGAVTGILICLLIFPLAGYRTLFLVAAVPSVIGAALIFFLIRERPSAGAQLFRGITLRDMDGNFRLFLFLNCLFTLGSFSYSFLLLYAKHAGFSDTAVPALYLVFTACASLASYPFGRLSDRIGRKKVLLAAYLLWGLVCAGFLLSAGPASSVIAFILYGLHRGALDTVQKTFVSELAPPGLRASTLGGFQMATGLCALPASLIAGLLWDTYGAFVPFIASLVLTAVAALLLLRVKEKIADPSR